MPGWSGPGSGTQGQSRGGIFMARLGRPYRWCPDGLLHRMRGPPGVLSRGGARSDRVAMAPFYLSEPCALDFLEMREPEARGEVIGQEALTAAAGLVSRLES